MQARAAALGVEEAQRAIKRWNTFGPYWRASAWGVVDASATRG